LVSRAGNNRRLWWDFLLNGPVARREAPWRFKLQSALTLAVGLIGLVVGVGGVYLQLHWADEQKAFHSAAECSAPQTAAMSRSCSYTGPATITGSHRDVRIFVDLRFAAMPSRTFTTSFSTKREPPTNTVSAGISQAAQLWDGKVTKYAGVGTVDDPDYQQTNAIPAALIFAVVGLFISIWSTVLVRRAWRR
jgi:hypothetical protein